MTRIHQIGRSAAVAIVALLLIAGAAFAHGMTFEPTAARPTVDQPVSGADDGAKNDVQDQAGNTDDANQNDGNQNDGN